MTQTGVDIQPQARDINNINFSKKNDIHIKAKNKTNEMIMEIDSAAQCNVILLETIEKLKNEQKIINESKKSVNLVSFTAERAKKLGTCKLQLQIVGKNENLTYPVFSINRATLLCVTDALRLALIYTYPEVYEINEQSSIPPSDIMEKYGERFSELPGTLPVTYKMKLKSDVKPVIRSAERVPVARQEKVKM